MADDALASLGRVVVGLLLQRGGFGHQVLGQMLLSDTTSLQFVGASVVVAATSANSSVVAQTLMRTVAPSLAVYAIARQEEARLERLARFASDPGITVPEKVRNPPPGIHPLTEAEHERLQLASLDRAALATEVLLLRERLAQLETRRDEAPSDG